MSVAPTPSLDRALLATRSPLQDFCTKLLHPPVLIRLVLYLTGLIYLRSVLFDYVFDDSILIIVNPWMASWKCVPAIFTHSFWGFLEIPRVIDFYRPLVMLAFAAIFHLFGPAPGWFHLVAVSLHLGATYLVYRFAFETTTDQSLSAIAAGIFGLHPTRVETAAWISGLSDSLCAVFLLSSLICYFKWKEKREHSSRFLAFSSVLFFLALLSKEAAIFVPIVVAIYELSATHGKFVCRCRNALTMVWPFVAVSAITITVRRLVVHNYTQQLMNGVSPATAILTAPETIWWYIDKQFWPVVLSPYYPIITVTTFSITRFLLPLLLLIACFAAIGYAVRRKPTGIFYASWIVIMLAPVVIYEPALQVHDRYSYLPSIATSIGLAYIFAWTKRLGSVVQSVTVLILFGLMAIGTLSYESYWDNDVKLFTRAVQIAPRNPDAAEFLASVYVNSHQPEKAEAVARTLINDPDLRAKGWYILGTVQAISYEDYASAQQAFQKSTALFDHHNFLANMGLASADMKLGRSAEAIEIYREELKSYPTVVYIHSQLAMALKQVQNHEQAGH